MPEVGKWLEKLGLGQYAERFSENDILFSILQDLTDQDLKELGVSSLGHRRLLLRAIAELDKLKSGPNEPAAPIGSEDSAERRQVTVMFSDLVGSTALSARMDPEDLREIISTYQKCVAETVRRFGGFVAKYMGDGVLVYFGYPQAHEDDAERAVRAALELVAAIAALKSPVSLQTRIGIATGLVVVGDLIGSGEAQERGIVGETPNLSARLQGIAAPNMVVIAEGTRKLLGNLFELEDLGPRNLKGIAGPVPAFAAMRASAVASRFEALHASGLTELVGREEEVELLQRRWAKAKSGEGQVVLIAGEAGIGKSRLTAVLLERLSSESYTRLRSFCSAQHTDSAFHPIIGQMERAARLARDDLPQAKLDKLDTLLVQSSTSVEDATLIAEMLSLANDGRYPALNLTPAQRRQRTLEALVLQVAAFARRNPVLLIFEDAHWTDPTSLELFGRIVDRITTLRALLIVTFRPEFEPPWIGRPHVTALTLNRLAQRDIDAMIDGVVGNKLIPASIRQDIIERTDGIPLFVEEMTKAVLEAESEGRARRTAAHVPASALAVPASLHASLMARLDRLGSAKEVAQIAAAIGREFSHALLAAVVGKPETELNLALERLIAAGLLFRQGLPPQATYLFKHALVQDAAYGTLLREPRHALQARIAGTLENQFAEIAESRPELLARHYAEAGLIEKAVGLWGKAGQRSLERSALVEAAAQFTRALDQITTLPGTPALRRDEIKLQVGLANALMYTQGHAATETKAAFEHCRALIDRAEALGEPTEDPLLLYSVLYGFFIQKFIAFDGDAACTLARQFLTLAEKQKAAIPTMIGHRLLGTTLLCIGNAAEALSQLDRCLTIYDSATHRPLATRFGQDVGAAAMAFRPLALWLLGYPGTASVEIGRAIDAARDTGHAPTLMFVLGCTTFTHICRRDHAAAKLQIDEALALTEEKGAVFFNAMATAQRGCELALTGKSAAAVATISAGVTGYRSTGATVWTTLPLSLLATAYADLGKFDDAWRHLGETMKAVETANERWYEADINRISGEIALNSPEPDATKAQVYFERALSLARAQHAKSLELRAATSMARLLRDQGKRDKAHELLAPVYGWFTEGFDTPDLKEAKALLAS
jgi:class 3 adenylate cyclase/predicted ATPase